MLKIEGIIKTKEQYEIALERVYTLMQLDLKEGSSELNEAELLGVLIEQYEKIHYPIAPPHPIEAIKFYLDQMGVSEIELNILLGSRSRKSEILSGKRKLSLSMIRTLHEKLEIPAETLIRAY
jgi:HTH-type transcriptional regulator / antitoxin HigA